MNRRGAWTWAEIENFRQWHADLLQRLAYPPSIVAELAAARDKWLSAVPVK